MSQSSVQLTLSAAVAPDPRAVVHAAVDRAVEAAHAEIRDMAARAIETINRRAGQYRRRLCERLPA